MKFTVLLAPDGIDHRYVDYKDVGRLRSVRLEASGEDPITELAHNAESEAGVSVMGSIFLFPSVPREDGTRELTGVPDVIVKVDGTLHWLGYPQDFTGVTVGDLERSRDEGLLPRNADPHCVLYGKRTIGDGAVTQTWLDLFQWLDSFGDVAGAIGTVLWVARWVRYLGRPPQDETIAHRAWLKDFFARHQKQWEASGARSPVYVLQTVLDRDEWRSGELRRWLGTDPAETERLLDILGYEYQPTSRVHVVSGDPQKLKLRNGLKDYILW